MTSAAFASTNDGAISIEHVSKSYARRRAAPTVALDGVSLTIPQDQWLALLGPNASGKSTLMRLISGLDRPDAGRVLVLGHDMAHARARGVASRDVGVVFQHVALDPLLTVRENLRTQAALHGRAGAQAGVRATDAASQLGVSDRLDDRVGTLSGGLARRADLARALMHLPRVLLLDEPTSGLDHASRMGFLDLVESLRSRSITIVMSTHMMDEAERADRVVMLDQGRIVADDSPGRLRRRHAARVIRLAPKDADERHRASAVLKTHGIEFRDASAGGVVATISDDRPEAGAAIAAGLTTAGIAFEFGPPTLADVYLARTGHRLQEEVLA